MTEIKVLGIPSLLQIPNLKSTFSNLIIFVTTRPNYYNFGSASFFQMNIADVDNPVVNKKDISNLQFIIEHCPYDTIYVCCDAGLSRSPAVAYFIAVKLGYTEQAKKIKDKYRFMNIPLYTKLMKMIP